VSTNKANASSIAYCGLHCGDCPNHSGEIADLARDLRKKLREYHFERVAPGLATFFKPFANYELCYETLGAMVKLRCKRGCRDNGGPPQCKIRNCCRKRDFDGCWQCVDFETCEKLNFLTATHGDAHIKNLGTIKKRGVDVFLTGKRYW
jgi:Protein of unknown function (DUF3795)